MVLSLTRLALSATLAASPAVAHTSQSVVRPVAADSTVLTAEALTKMATFWKSFLQDTPSIRDTARAKNQEKINVPLGKMNGVQAPPSIQATVVNMVAMAQNYPSVAAKFKAAGLTPQEWEADRIALFSGAMTSQLDPSGKSTGDGSNAWKNVVALREHAQEYAAVQATGMFIPKLQVGGGGMGGGGNDDLSP